MDDIGGDPARFRQAQSAIFQTAPLNHGLFAPVSSNSLELPPIVATLR
jgi:hypothetical protein